VFGWIIFVNYLFMIENGAGQSDIGNSEVLNSTDNMEFKLPGVEEVLSCGPYDEESGITVAGCVSRKDPSTYLDCQQDFYPGDGKPEVSSRLYLAGCGAAGYSSTQILGCFFRGSDFGLSNLQDVSLVLISERSEVEIAGVYKRERELGVGSLERSYTLVPTEFPTVNCFIASSSGDSVRSHVLRFQEPEEASQTISRVFSNPNVRKLVFSLNCDINNVGVISSDGDSVYVETQKLRAMTGLYKILLTLALIKANGVETEEGLVKGIFSEMERKMRMDRDVVAFGSKAAIHPLEDDFCLCFVQCLSRTLQTRKLDSVREILPIIQIDGGAAAVNAVCGMLVRRLGEDFGLQQGIANSAVQIARTQMSLAKENFLNGIFSPGILEEIRNLGSTVENGLTEFAKQRKKAGRLSKGKRKKEIERIESAEFDFLQKKFSCGEVKIAVDITKLDTTAFASRKNYSQVRAFLNQVSVKNAKLKDSQSYCNQFAKSIWLSAISGKVVLCDENGNATYTEEKIEGLPTLVEDGEEKIDLWNVDVKDVIDAIFPAAVQSDDIEL
jgi:hypothetical protein